MPYSKSQVSALPAYVQALPADQRAQWIEVWNSTYQAAKQDGKSDKDAEAVAFRNANGVLKRRGVQLSTEREGPIMTWFSKLTRKDREKLDLANFGDPDRRLFPIMDQSDVDAAAHLLGKAADPAAVKARVIAIAKRKGFKLPDAWMSAVAEPVHAESADLAVLRADTESVVRRGKLFTAGDYPDKHLTISPEELLVAAADFTEPLPLKLEHRDTILNDHLGALEAITVSEDGWELNGDVRVPRWLNDLLGEAPLKVSTTWNRATKRLDDHLGLVLDPRVPDAAVFAAFAGTQTDPASAASAFAATADALIALAKRHDTPYGQAALQMIHNIATERGAVCKAGNAAMASGHEAAAMQRIHDLSIEHGAICSTIQQANSPALPFVMTDPAIQRANSPAWHFGAGQEAHMGFWDQFKATFGLPSEWTPPTGVAEPPAPPPPPSPGPDPRAAEFARVAAENRQLRQQVLEGQAAQFADKYIEAGKAYPAERAQIITAYVQAAQDDAQMSAAATFDGQAQSRVGLLTAAFDARPAHKLTSETFAAGIEQFVLANQDATQRPSDNPSPERMAKLREHARVNGSN